jgi:hypothetical protein
MSLVLDAMATAQARTHARLAVLRALHPLSFGERIAVLAEAMLEVESPPPELAAPPPAGQPAPAPPLSENHQAPTPQAVWDGLFAPKTRAKAPSPRAKPAKAVASPPPALAPTPPRPEPRRKPAPQEVAPAHPTAARPSPRPGAGAKPTRSQAPAPKKKVNHLVGTVAALVAKTPGISAADIAKELQTTRARLTRTVRLAVELGLIAQRGKKSSTRYFPPGA